MKLKLLFLLLVLIQSLMITQVYAQPTEKPSWFSSSSGDAKQVIDEKSKLVINIVAFLGLVCCIGSIFASAIPRGLGKTQLASVMLWGGIGGLLTLLLGYPAIAIMMF